MYLPTREILGVNIEYDGFLGFYYLRSCPSRELSVRGYPDSFHQKLRGLQ